MSKLVRTYAITNTYTDNILDKELKSIKINETYFSFVDKKRQSKILNVLKKIDDEIVSSLQKTS
jgi:hypothetical protein